jgi:hypothetical protein
VNEAPGLVNRRYKDGAARKSRVKRAAMKQEENTALLEVA